jgi:hypothetical protein
MPAARSRERECERGEDMDGGPFLRLQLTRRERRCSALRACSPAPIRGVVTATRAACLRTGLMSRNLRCPWSGRPKRRNADGVHIHRSGLRTLMRASEVCHRRSRSLREAGWRIRAETIRIRARLPYSVRRGAARFSGARSKRRSQWRADEAPKRCPYTLRRWATGAGDGAGYNSRRSESSATCAALSKQRMQTTNVTHAVMPMRVISNRLNSRLQRRWPLGFPGGAVPDGYGELMEDCASGRPHMYGGASNASVFAGAPLTGVTAPASRAAVAGATHPSGLLELQKPGANHGGRHAELLGDR